MSGDKTFDVERRKRYKIVFVIFVNMKNRVAYLLDAKGSGKCGFGSGVALKLKSKLIASSDFPCTVWILPVCRVSHS